MRAITLFLFLATLVGCGASEPEMDPALDLLGDVVRVVELAETEVLAWHDEVEPLRGDLASVPSAVDIFEQPKPTMADVHAIRDRVDLLVSALPRRSNDEVLASLSVELESANAAVAAYRGPRKQLCALAELRAYQK